MLIENRDWPNWQYTMRTAADAPADAGGAKRGPVTRPRPGHADLAGGAKYERDDLRDILERASARETASRVAAGAFARQLLAHAGIRISSHVFTIGSHTLADRADVDFARASALPDDAPLRCVDSELEKAMIAEIDRAREAGDTIGGAFEVIATGVPIGLGSYVQWDRKLDGRLAQALMSIPATKAVGIGLGPDVATRPRPRVPDGSLGRRGSNAVTGLARPTNAGGLGRHETSVSVRMKRLHPEKLLWSVDLATYGTPAATSEDVCAVPAAAVVGEAMVALVLADALLERFGADSIAALDRAMASADAALRARFAERQQTT